MKLVKFLMKKMTETAEPEGGEPVSKHKQSYMEPGMCIRGHCFNKGPRCGKGFCTPCCRAFHDHLGPGEGSVVATNFPGISTAIQPEPAPVYEVGEIRLVCTQDVSTLRQGGDLPSAG